MSECPKDTLHSKTDNYTKPQPRPQPRPQQTHRQIAIPLPPKKIQDKLTNANDWYHGDKCISTIQFTANLDKATVVVNNRKKETYHFNVEWYSNGTFRLLRNNGDYNEFKTNLILGKNKSISNIGYGKTIIREIDIKWI